jgi:dTDP-4-amino-4,6-dideoxygalactose transaminase
MTDADSPVLPRIPFNRPHLVGQELDNIRQAHASGMLSGDGPFTRQCHVQLQALTGSHRALLTHSCTAALEMAALLANLGPGDEVILPSYTFVSTANAFVLRGATPVFVDIREDTLNLDERLVEAAITPRTRALCVVHYAGVGCAMDVLTDLAERHNLVLIEDAAQAICARWRGRALGSFGPLAALSFHETKNVTCGEGGALLINAPEMVQRAEILREKGTDRSRFFRGEVDKYSWVDLGSSFLPGELSAAFLSAQLDAAETLTTRRLAIWQAYHAWAEPHERAGRLRRPVVPDDCTHNAHMYYILLPDAAARTQVMADLKDDGVHAVFHYVPLHSSRAGRQFGRAHGALRHTDDLSARLLRLPLWIGVEPHLPRIFAAADRALARLG